MVSSCANPKCCLPFKCLYEGRSFGLGKNAERLVGITTPHHHGADPKTVGNEDESGLPVEIAAMITSNTGNGISMPTNLSNVEEVDRE